MKRQVMSAEQLRSMSPEMEQQMRSIARSFGADPEFMMRVIQQAEVRPSGDHYRIISNIPQRTTEEMRATDLAMEVLSFAYGNMGPGGRRERPEFSLSTMGMAASHYMSGHPTRFALGRGTEMWLTRQAERFGLDYTALSNSILSYSLLSRTHHGMAEAALEQASGGDARVMAFARAVNERIRISAREGRTRFYIRTADVGSAIAEYRRESGDHVMRSRPRRA